MSKHRASTTTRRTFGAALVGALLAIVATGGVATASQQRDAAARVRKSVAVTRDEGTAHMVGTITIDSSDVSGTVDLDGVIDLAGTDGELTIDMSALGLDGELQERIVDGVAYMNMADLLDAAGVNLPDALADTPWVSLDLSDLTAADANSVAPGTGSNPSSQLDALLGVAKNGVDTVGNETLRGVATTHYHADIDVAAAIDRLPQRFKDRFEEALNAVSGADELPVDVWLDADGRVRKQETSITVRVKGKRVSEKIAFEYVEFGVPVDVEAPPADQVIDLEEFKDLASSLTS
jgi:hypothetical protein